MKKQSHSIPDVFGVLLSTRGGQGVYLATSDWIEKENRSVVISINTKTSEGVAKIAAIVKAASKCTVTTSGKEGVVLWKAQTGRHCGEGLEMELAIANCLAQMFQARGSLTKKTGG